MKTRSVLAAFASIALLGGVALAQTSDTNSPAGSTGKTGTSAEPAAPQEQPGTLAPTEPGASQGGNEGQNPPAPQPGEQGTMGGHGSMETTPGAAGAAAGTAGETTAQGGAPTSREQLPYEAAKHIAVVNAGLVDGATNASLLKQITANPASYDQDHGRVFVNNIKQAVTQAEAHLVDHLKPLTTGTATTKVEAIQARLDRVRDMLPKMEGELASPKALGSDAGHVADQLRGGIRPLKDLTKTLQAKVTIHSVG